MTRNCRQLALDSGYDVYTYKEWIRPYKYGPRVMGIYVPEEIRDAIQAKAKATEAKRDRAAERAAERRREQDRDSPGGGYNRGYSYGYRSDYWGYGSRNWDNAYSSW
jgi:hypothetical protein